MRYTRIRTLVQWTLITSILAFWAYAVWSQWDAIAGYPWQVGWAELLGAQFLLLAQMFLLAVGWWRILVLMGGHLPWQVGASMWLRAQLARYLPGGVWDIAGRAALSRDTGIPLRMVPAGATLEIALQIYSATLFLLGTLVLFPTPRLRPYLPFLLLGMFLMTVALTPPLFTRGLHTAFRLLKRPPLPIRLTLADVLTLLGLYMTAHLMQGLGFVLFTHGLTRLRWQDTPLLVGSYVGAWLVGYLAIFAPTGIGVREGALVLLLGKRLPFALITGAALGYRVWLSLRDVLAALIGLGLNHTWNRSDSD